MLSNWQALSLLPTRTNTDSSCSVLCRASTSRNVSQIKEVHGRDNLGHAAAGRSRMTLFGIMACKIQSRLWVKTGKAQCEHMFSALPLRADIGEQSRHVRFVPTRDMSIGAARPAAKDRRGA